MVRVTQLGYLGIGVRDIGVWETFAMQTLGLQVGARDDDGTFFLRIDAYHHRFAFPAALHAHLPSPPVPELGVAATAARARAAPLCVPTRDRSVLPPSLAGTAATAWPSPGRW